MGDFHGEPTGFLENDFLRVEYLQTSPRVVRLIPSGKENLFADLGRSALETPYGYFFFRGGHRLWHAPEEFPRTYIPDSTGSVVEPISNGVRIRQPVEPQTQIEKTIQISIDPKEPKVIVRHELRNAGKAPAEFAPWALSMMRLGGVAIIPQPTGNEKSKLPNRQLVMWPYSSIKDPRLDLADDFILVQAEAKQPALKFGGLCSHGWMGYWLDGTLFIKKFNPPKPRHTYPDWGCNYEIYCNDKFIELETLGTLKPIAPGTSVMHTETWEIYDSVELDWIPQEVQRKLTG